MPLSVRASILEEMHVWSYKALCAAGKMLPLDAYLVLLSVVCRKQDVVPLQAAAKEEKLLPGIQTKLLLNRRIHGKQ